MAYNTTSGNFFTYTSTATMGTFPEYAPSKHPKYPVCATCAHGVPPRDMVEHLDLHASIEQNKFDTLEALARASKQPPAP